MSVVTGEAKPTLFPYLAVSSMFYTIDKTNIGIIRALITGNGTWNLPALSSLKHGAFLWIDNQTSFPITLHAAGSDLINGNSSYVINNNSFATIYTSTQWNASFEAGGGGVTPGSTNTGYGFQTLISLSSGTNNSAFGYQTMQFNNSGSNNSALGYQAMQNNQTGSTNTSFGSLALQSNIAGSQNSAFGAGALNNNLASN
ncbi:MAG TPA: hypothetical protein VN704_05580, partial [Verrucomicrobiae bacterium]|nr:hypothetical protein [Verrucomicrobiae bacterium]